MVNDWVDIGALLPHKAPMLMLSNIVAQGETDIHCQAYIEEGNPFVQDGMFPGFACLELVAQTCGIFLGMGVSGGADSSAPHSGVIASVKGMSIDLQQIYSGMTLDVIAEFLGGNQQAAMFSGKVLLDKNKIFESKVTVAMLDEKTL